MAMRSLGFCRKRIQASEKDSSTAEIEIRTLNRLSAVRRFDGAATKASPWAPAVRRAKYPGSETINTPTASTANSTQAACTILSQGWCIYVNVAV